MHLDNSKYMSSLLPFQLNLQLLEVRKCHYYVHSLFSVFAPRELWGLSPPDGHLALLLSWPSKSCLSSYSLMLSDYPFSDFSDILKHLLHLLILSILLYILTVLLKCFISVCLDFPKLLVNLMGLGRMMLTSLYFLASLAQCIEHRKQQIHIYWNGCMFFSSDTDQNIFKRRTWESNKQTRVQVPPLLVTI